ncbi:MAG: hypothetical protein D4R65_13160 [Verrucomicrobiaceae bacterium]|nr:MAG: hypothetical protein D4R65_13160 [Verrucomicrobiaceae bacterium]
MMRDHPYYADDLRLLRFACQISSQSGEDGIIAEIFNRIGETNRIFVEVGVGDGTENNTLALAVRGWSGLWIDGDPSSQRTVSTLGESVRNKLRAKIAFVDRENISALVKEHEIPREFDFLSLDIDQNTYYLWEGLNDYLPRVVCVEYNANIPPAIDWKVDYSSERVWDKSRNFGASLKAFENLGRNLGYSLIGCDFAGANAFFVRNDQLFGKFKQPYTAENHHFPPQYFANFDFGHPKSVWDIPDSK